MSETKFFCPDCQRTEGCVCMMDYDDGEESGPACEFCNEGSYELQTCDNCNFMMCPKCWGPQCIDDLYVGWCHDCAG